MTQLFILVLLFWVAPPTMDYLLEPRTLFEFDIIKEKPPSCLNFTATEKRKMELEPDYKASTYTLKPAAICRREIIPYGTRDSFYDFITRHCRKRAIAVAAHIKSKEKQNSASYFVRVLADSKDIKHYVTQVFNSELTIALGEGKVVRQYNSENTKIIDIYIRRIQSAEFSFDIRLLSPHHGKSKI